MNPLFRFGLLSYQSSEEQVLLGFAFRNYLTNGLCVIYFPIRIEKAVHNVIISASD